MRAVLRDRSRQSATDPRSAGDLGVNDEGIAVILDLVDQLHGLRRTLRELLSRCASSRTTANVGHRLPHDGHRPATRTTPSGEGHAQSP